MVRPTKIVFLGASSASFGMSMFRDLFSRPDAAVEVPVVADAAGIHPVSLGRCPTAWPS
ncbi:hypothetical protein [Bradyrhizobium liaoningense]|uniref:hypothetical protein n=1 Tax=Bradyrhizobium liaoningense TaxID=43992 RepID=UPI0004B2BDEB|nr:hypothetical protein [Bradyrhizobium liaoningense]